VQTVGIVSPGAMGSALGVALMRGGARTVATVADRSERTRRLAARAELELLESLDEVVAESNVVLSIVPPGEARAVAGDIGRAAAATGARPLLVELNAIAPKTARAIVRDAELEVVDGSVSGPPPWRAGATRVYLSGARAAEVATLPFQGVRTIVVGEEIGAASAVKMSTASVYKGTSALLAQALLAARENGVLEYVLDDLAAAWPEPVANVAQRLASAASKSDRYVAEMREIAATQASAGLTPRLFEAVAEVFEALAETEVARRAPEDVGDIGLDDLLEGMTSERRPHVRQ